MLKDDREVALNDVLVMCRKSADHYLQAAELSDDHRLGDMFDRMATRRIIDADRMETIVRNFGYLPGDPDSDRQDFLKLITLARSTVSSDSGRILIEKAIDMEIELEEKINCALLLEPSEHFFLPLQELRESSRHHRDEMVEQGTMRGKGTEG